MLGAVIVRVDRHGQRLLGFRMVICADSVDLFRAPMNASAYFQFAQS